MCRFHAMLYKGSSALQPINSNSSGIYLESTLSHWIGFNSTTKPNGITDGHVLFSGISVWVAVWNEGMPGRVPFQYKYHLCRYEDFHYKDKTVLRTSYLGPYVGNTAFVYWDGLRVFVCKEHMRRCVIADILRLGSFMKYCLIIDEHIYSLLVSFCLKYFLDSIEGPVT